MSRSQQFKPIKPYEEYVVDFKKACKELGKTLTSTELNRHDFGLPQVHWFINNCSSLDVTTYNEFLVYIGCELFRKYRKYTYEIAFEEFAKRGLTLLPQVYVNCSVLMDYICPKHPDVIQHKSVNNLIFGNNKKGEGCLYCYLDYRVGEGAPSWKGGTSFLNTYLREYIGKWKKDSMADCNYKCVVTGNGFHAIHHLYSFNKMLKEIIEECNLPIHTIIGEYTNEELDLLKQVSIRIHAKYPLGVCLSKSIHSMYHKIYGDDNTPDQFDEFKVRYNNGEFEDIVVVVKHKPKIIKPKPIKSKPVDTRVKYTSEQLAEIRYKYENENCTLEELSIMYSVKQAIIKNIVTYKRAQGWICLI